ncbi:MAG TPA: M24 family metallopeptidase, partial [Candidatus Poseidoniales archaeon]|nr:M24 family metallopeptidase [Candidatus Poseidoniales archaeon]
YTLVLEAQQQAIDACVVGVPYTRPHEVASEVLKEGLIELGLITVSGKEESETQLGRFFMHNTSHWIGLDVHDVGTYQPDKEPRLLEEGMVLTIEPGLYIAGWRSDLSDVDDAWKGIGVRIEDDIHVTAEGPDVLSSDCPKTIDDIEAIVGSV